MLKTKPDLKVVFGSGYTAEHIARKGILEKHINFISKPYDLNTFAKKVREILDS